MTQEQFDSLLTWLGNDRDVAGRRYETIRSGLVRVFVSKGFSDAEDLADKTIDRVMVRLPAIRRSYIGEPAYYFHGVAKNIIRECGRRREIATDVVDRWIEPNLEPNEEHDCLRHCLDCLPVSKRDLILNYYLHDGHEKVEHHKHMAGQLNISEGAIRSRAYQIRLRLATSMQQCALHKKRANCLAPHASDGFARRDCVRGWRRL
jgi:RNA polymerase sigma factor (sigma-70 family)